LKNYKGSYVRAPKLIWFESWNICYKVYRGN
jgi:hypothetical protein